MLGLAFSGGKDSLACWYLYRHAKPVVLWVNTGKAYPETIELVDEIRAQSQFIEITSDQHGQIEEHGLPSDIVPIDWTTLGMTFTGHKPVKVQSYLGCCYENISAPLMRAAKHHGITTLVRGQRLDEDRKSPARDGDVVEGITFRQPIEHWNQSMVFDFIRENRGSIPEHFYIKHSSLDCYDCTAFRKDSEDRIRWTQERHPILFEQYAAKAGALNSALQAAQ